VFETYTYNLPSVLPKKARKRWTFLESNSAAAVIQAVCPQEWRDIVSVLSTYELNAKCLLTPGGNRGIIAEQIDAEFVKRGWREARLDLETKGILFGKDKIKITELPPIYQEGYLVDNFKNRIVLDVEWNAKDGNLDRDLAAYRSWYDAGVISAGVIITKDRIPIRDLTRKLWADHLKTLPPKQQKQRIPVDLSTSTVTSFDKAEIRVRRGVMGSCPILIIGAIEATWNGKPYQP
jgi:hypothetical protein